MLDSVERDRAIMAHDGHNKLLARIPVTIFERSVHEGWDEGDWARWLNSSEAAPFRIWRGTRLMAIDRDAFFDRVRADPFGGNLTQSQVDGMNYLLDVWEEHFAEQNPTDGTQWLAYCLATAFHETAADDGADRGIREGRRRLLRRSLPGPMASATTGAATSSSPGTKTTSRASRSSATNTRIECPMVRYPHRMLEHEPAALILYDGSIDGWFTGVGLPQYFNAAKGIEDPYNARRVINGTDKADLIAGYYEASRGR